MTNKWNKIKWGIKLIESECQDRATGGKEQVVGETEEGGGGGEAPREERERRETEKDGYL